MWCSDKIRSIWKAFISIEVVFGQWPLVAAFFLFFFEINENEKSIQPSNHPTML
jgi:hypothetical protein